MYVYVCDARYKFGASVRVNGAPVVVAVHLPQVEQAAQLHLQAKVMQVGMAVQMALVVRVAGVVVQVQ